MNDVSITAGNHKTILSPGRHVLLTHQGINALEQINPIGCIGHRNIDQKTLTNDIMRFSSEFSIVTALNGLKPFIQMKHSSNPRDVRLVKQLQKNAAVLMQMNRAAGAYKQLSTPRRYLSAQR